MASHPSIAELRACSSVVASAEQVSCDLFDEAVVLSLRDGAYYGMNPVAARVWQLVQQPTHLSALCDALLAEYDVPADQCEREVMALLRQLVEWKLVEVLEARAA